MSENKEQVAPQNKKYVSQVLLAWETKENEGKLVFPKKSCACRSCPFMDWQIAEVEIPVDEDEPNQEQNAEPQFILDLTNYCHDRYKETWGRGLPNIIDCDGKYKQPKE